MSNNQLTSPANFNIANLIFGEPKENTMEINDDPSGRPTTIKFYRIDIKYRNQDKTVGDLILGCDRLKSAFGLSPKFGTFHLNMLDAGNPTDLQVKTVEVINEIVEKCREHLISVRVEIGKPRMSRSNLEGETDITPLKYAKKDIDPKTGLPAKNAIPNLSVKLNTVGKKDTSGKKYKDTFYNEEDDSLVDPEDLIDKRCEVIPAIKIESIFVGQVIKVQTKLAEAIVKLTESGPRRLLSGFRQPQQVMTSDPFAKKEESDEEEAEEEQSSSALKASDDEQDEQEESSEQQGEPEPEPEPETKPRKGRKSTK